MKKDATENQIYENRELSWLTFNSRVLEEAKDINNPLCERLTFLSIFQSNLDEFFMVRVGSLCDQMLLDTNSRDSKTNMTAKEQITAILKKVKSLSSERDDIYQILLNALAQQNIHLLQFKDLSETEAKKMEQYFCQEIKPLLSTIIVGKKQPFPFLKGKDIYVMAALATKGEKIKIGIIPCSSDVFPRLIEIPGRNGAYMLTEELILHFAAQVFTNYRVWEKSLIRITRNADIDADRVSDEDLDYREHMSEIVKKRKKLSPVRLEYTRPLNEGFLKKVSTYMGLSEEQLFLTKLPLDLSFFFTIQDTLRSNPSLFYEKRAPQKSKMLEKDKPILEQVAKQDILLSYPYESFKPFIQMLHEAANDPNVVSIKMTLYRLAKHSKVVEALIEALENGKQVDVLVELKARFDEENNIEWSRQLEDAGCHVIYGLDGLKVHSKLCLITRKSQNKIEYFTQIGTGNYNEKTARLYTDLSLLTANKEIGLEAAGIFHALSLGEVVESAKHLLIAPKCLQNKVLAMIDEEIAHKKKGEDAYIGIKMNSLTDKKIIDKLIEASQAGVKIDMIIRGICCLRSGIPGFTENIRVISIVGRYLEHSRIYMFGTKERMKLYIASADFMTRNTCRRVEVAAPIYDTAIREWLYEMFNLMLQDNKNARLQTKDGTYVRLLPKKAEPLINSQALLYEKAYETAADTF